MELFMFSSLIYFILYLLVFFSVVRVPENATKGKKLKNAEQKHTSNAPLMLVYIALISAVKLYLAFSNTQFVPTSPASTLYMQTGVTNFASNMAGLFGLTGASFFAVAKILAVVADGAFAFIVYKLAVKNGFDHKKAQVFATAGILLPSLVVAGSLFGWATSVTLFVIALALFMLYADKPVVAGVLFGIGAFCETLGLMAAVIYLVYVALSYERKDLVTAIVAVVAPIVVLPVVVMPEMSYFESLKTVFMGATEYSYVAPSLFSLIGGCGVIAKPFAKIFTLALTVGLTVLGGFLFKKSEVENKLCYVLAFVLTVFALFASGQNAATVAVAGAVCIIGYIKTKDSFFAITFVADALLSCLATLIKLMYVNGNVSTDDKTLSALAIVSVICAIVYIVIGIRKITQGTIKAVADNSRLSSKSAGINRAADRIISSGNKTYQFQRSDIKTKIVRTDALLIAVLMLLYGLFAFTNLGSMNTPQTEYQPTQDNAAFEVAFGEPQNVARVSMFTTWIDRRTDNDVVRDVQVFASYDGGSTYQEATQMKIQEVLRWRYVPLNLNGVTNLRFNIIDEPRFVLNEMVFYDAQKNIVPVIRATNIVGSDTVGNLFDEQDTAVYAPTWYDGSYFDEIYHPRTAYEHIHHYEMYENSHPPLGKLMMSLGILIFGLCPFGWRFFGVFFAMMMIPVVYILAKKMFKSSKWAFIAGALLVFDCMTTVQARLATIDTYVTFYIILMTLFMYSYYTKSFYDTKLSKTLVPLGLCGLAFGLGTASKWTGLYAGVGLAIVFFINFGKRCYEYYIACTDKKNTENNGISYAHIRAVFPKNATITILFAILMFVIVPAGIYVASYIPYFMIPKPNHDFAAFMRLQRHMFNYHSGLTATHPYASRWYQWPMIYRPMLYAVQTAESRVEGFKHGIAALGNPAIWWMTYPCLIGSAIVALRRKWNSQMTVIFTMFMSIWLLWSGITRNVFIYHFFTNTPLLMLWIVFFMKYLNEHCKVPMYAIYTYMAVVVVLYAMFYPVLVGMDVPAWYIDEVLEWFPTRWVLG